MDRLVRNNSDGSYSIMLWPCPTSIARELLDPAVPFIWVVNHIPNPIVEWWHADVPLRKGDSPGSWHVRGLRFDVLFSTREFLDQADKFDGVTLYQTAKAVPNTLSIERLSEDRLIAILRQNGLVAYFYQPHSMEVACYKTWDNEWLRKVLEKESVRQLALSN